jgi:hypothetical protein
VIPQSDGAPIAGRTLVATTLILAASLIPAIATPVQAQESGPAAVAIGYERTRDRFHYRFENPSSIDTPELVPHEFTQTYWGDNRWIVLRGAFTVRSRRFETEAAATPRRTTRGDDYDTFFPPSGDIVVTGTTGGISMRSWRVRQAIVLGRKAGVEWHLAYQYRSDRSEFHAGLKSTSHTQPPSYEESVVFTRETTISRNFGPEVRLARGWRGAGWRVILATAVAPITNGRLTILLPEKYPGQTIVFNAFYASVEPRLTVAIGQRWPIILDVGYDCTYSYARSHQFVRSAMMVGVSVGWRPREHPVVRREGYREMARQPDSE